MYEYNAIVTDVHDGDTVTVDLDLGVDTWKHAFHVRLLGGNARELKDPGGAEAHANLSALLPLGSRVVVLSHKTGHDIEPDKYGGRYLASITLPDGRDLATLLVEQQWLAPWDGKGARPLPPWPRKIP
uniref:TNase-like domain-containing protein n=1 Tax=Streptomyces sp. NBC_01393 TaxID=2903851 RepID=A0AAU3I7W5_9ACTN